MPPYEELDREIRKILSEGCIPSETVQYFLDNYPSTEDEAIEVLKQLQCIAREQR